MIKCVLGKYLRLAEDSGIGYDGKGVNAALNWTITQWSFPQNYPFQSYSARLPVPLCEASGPGSYLPYSSARRDRHGCTRVLLGLLIGYKSQYVLSCMTLQGHVRNSFHRCDSVGPYTVVQKSGTQG
eukprot:360458-Chlamydomonas_euryale.AAC.11